MSRIGNSPITIPDGVSVEISANKILVKGKLGEIEQEFFDVSLKMNDGILNIERNSDENKLSDNNDDEKNEEN